MTHSPPSLSDQKEKTFPYLQGKTGPWEVVIGLEIHAQVISQSKLFSGAATEFGSSPNQQVAFLDAGFPGTLPVLNRVCVEQAVKTGLGIHAEIHTVSVFERKNYFYPDLPSGYQISQFHHPIVGEGYLDIDLADGATKRIRIERIHLEQDAGKSIHDQDPNKSYLDYNRAGVPLMEIVTRPDMRSIEEAQAFTRKLRSLLRCLGTCDGNMEQGSLRVDINVSLRRPGDPLGVRTETKNLNSVRFMGQAIQYEIQRQMDILDQGGSILQETRLFDVTKGVTRSMRSKEEAHDYRYFPDPDLPPLVLEPGFVDKIRAILPELPDAKKNRFMKTYGLNAYHASILTGEAESAHFYETAVHHTFPWIHGKIDQQKQAATLVANWIMGDLFAVLRREDLELPTSRISPKDLAQLIDLIMDQTISGRIAKDIFAQMWSTGQSPHLIVKDQGLEQVSDSQVLEKIVDGLIHEHPQMVTEYRQGKEKLLGFFVGQVMKAMAGKANPQVVNDILKQKLGS